MGVPDLTADLPGGGAMPLLGFGTWQLRGSAARRCVGAALAAGYRHIDTATMYGNEREVGAALRDSGLARGQVFVTTKLPPDRFGQERRTLEESLALLDVAAIDLWLIHWPPRSGVGESSWAELVRAREEGLVRDIGVSNYSLAQLDRLTAASGVAPAVNQVEWSPLRFDAADLVGHRDRGVVLEGYSGLKGGVLRHPTVRQVADSLGRTTAQVVIRWHLQHSVVVIPKSSHEDRIRSNADVDDFALTDEDMAALDGLHRG